MTKTYEAAAYTAMERRPSSSCLSKLRTIIIIISLLRLLLLLHEVMVGAYGPDVQQRHLLATVIAAFTDTIVNV